jgi:limonene-1,2-epoxide hydrolase
MKANTEVVMDFIGAWKAKDLNQVMGFFAADAVYHNIPLEPAEGIVPIRAVIESFIGMASQVEFVVRNVAETEDGTVLTERVDRFRIQEKWIELPVMGAFEITNGKISAWRDYFDLAQFQGQMPEA